MQRTTMVLALLFGSQPVAAQGLFEQAVSGEVPAEQPTAAEEGAPAQPAAALLPVPAYELGGYVRGDLFVGQAPGVDASEIKSGYGELALNARARAGSIADAYGELRLRQGMEWGSRFTDIGLREAYVNLYLGPVDLRLGHQVVAWGRADGVNPTDNLTPKDMTVRSANEDDRRLATMALRAWLNLQPLRLELVWVPFYSTSTLPPFELPGPITMQPPNEPDQNLTKGIGAVRLNLETAAVEGSLSYLVGHATLPGLKLVERIPPPLVSLRVGMSSYRQQVVGADFSTSVSDWFGLRGEVGYRQPFDYDTREDVPMRDLQYVVGVDREVFTDVTLLVQYVGRYVFDWEELPPGQIPSDPLSLPANELRDFLLRFDEITDAELQRKKRAIYGQQEELSHALAGRLAWATLHETLTLEIFASYNVTTEEYLARPKVSYNIADAVSVAAGAEIYGGPDDTLFGMADETLSTGFVELKASF